MYETLFLHVGWSKTGTSAIQKQMHFQRDDFLKKNILYPASIQWIDYSHHPFALSFSGVGPYSELNSPRNIISTVENELKITNSSSLIISSELSPFYFNYEEFLTFSKKFKRIQVLFSIRRRSDLILSLFNQLIKDANIRYRESLFNLTIDKIKWMDFFSVVDSWRNFVGVDNIKVFEYTENIVKDFFDFFLIDIDKEKNDPFFTIENLSLPNRCLHLIQECCKNKDDVLSYDLHMNNIINFSKKIDHSFDRHIIFSKEEQKIINNFYLENDEKLMRMLNSIFGFMVNVKDFNSVKGIDPSFRFHFE